MELTVLERIVLLRVLPAEGDFTTLKIVRKLREALSFSEDEHKEFGIEVVDGLIRWDAAKDVAKEIPVGEKATDLIVSSLKELNTEKKLTDEHFSLYEKFVEGANEAR